MKARIVDIKLVRGGEKTAQAPDKPAAKQSEGFEYDSESIPF